MRVDDRWRDSDLDPPKRTIPVGVPMQVDAQKLGLGVNEVTGPFELLLGMLTALRPRYCGTGHSYAACDETLHQPCLTDQKRAKEEASPREAALAHRADGDAAETPAPHAARRR